MKCLARFFSSARTRSLTEAYSLIAGLRKSGMQPTHRAAVTSLVLDSKLINDFNEKFLCLTFSLLLNPKHYQPHAVLEESLSKRILCLPDLTLQGANQVLGSLAKLKSEDPNFNPNFIFCQTVFDRFQTAFIGTCPNRELTNVFWAASILGLKNIGESFLARNLPLDSLPKSIASFDCVDLSLVCAALIEKPDSPLWPLLRSELISRRELTSKDIPSILCSLACAGVTDRELMLHLTTIIVRNKLLNVKNLPAIVWAVATADSVHKPLLDNAFDIILKEGHLITDPLELRRVSRGFAVNGYLRRVEKWLMTQVAKCKSSNEVSDTVIIWELVTNQLFRSAEVVFRSRPLSYWRERVANDTTSGSQLYHIYLASLIDSSLNFSKDELVFLKSLQTAFASVTEDMSSSTLHKNASEALRKLNYQHVSEYKEPTTGYLIDSFIPEGKIGIEVQGPTHFITDLETGANILRPADAFKHIVLRKVAGINVIQATPWNFGPKLKQKNTVLMKALLAGRPITNHSRN